MDINNFLGLALLSDAIDRQSAGERAGREAASQEQFLNNNSWCYIQSKEARPTRHKRYLLDFSKEYWLLCVGLDTGETKEILVGEELFNKAIDKMRLIQFSTHKDSDFQLFKERNSKSGAVLLKKYIDEKSNNYLARIYGKDSDSVCVVDFANRDACDSYEEGELLFVNTQNSETSDSEENSIDEDMWYNAINYSTFDIEEIIEDCADDDYIYAYFNDIEDTESFTISNEAPQKSNIIFIDNLQKVMCFNQLETEFGDALNLKDDEFEDWCNKNQDKVDKFTSLREKCYNIFVNGVVRMKKKALIKYPKQSRLDFCNMINAIWAIGIWFEQGKNQIKESVSREVCTKFINRFKLLSAGHEDLNEDWWKLF